MQPSARRSQLADYIKAPGLIPPLQSAYKRRRSTETALQWRFLFNRKIRPTLMYSWIWVHPNHNHLAIIQARIHVRSGWCILAVRRTASSPFFGDFVRLEHSPVTGLDPVECCTMRTSKAAFKRLNDNNPATSCTNLAGLRPIISQFTLLKHVIRLGRNLTNELRSAHWRSAMDWKVAIFISE